MKKKTNFIVSAGFIAALYTILTLISAMTGLSSGPIQLRLSEALVFLAYLTPAAIPGLTIGAAISNALTSALPLDIIFGAIATLIGAVSAYALSFIFKKSKRLGLYLSTLPNVISNSLIIPYVLKIAYGASEAIPFMMATVFIGELIASALLGSLIITALKNKINYIK